MIGNVLNEDCSTSAGVISAKKVEVNDDFTKMLTDKFNNDDVSDANQDCLGVSSIGDLDQLVSATLGVGW